MASTFTDNTGIEKIGDGEQSGAWGQTTNDNFDIVDRALNGSVSIALVGTTHTLTTSSGVLSDGQYAVLVFAGSPSGTNTVTIAPNTAQKTYTVRNTTTQSVVLSQGSGANVTVPAGLSKIVYANGGGTNAAVVDVTNTLSGNLTGNLTGNATTATTLQTARAIGGVNFNGAANIDLPGVNTAGTQNTTGSAASLTTARTFTIGGTGKLFSGVADVSWSLAEIGAADRAVVLTAGTGLTGGGNLTANRTFAIDIASQVVAEAGTDNTKVMTPLRAAQTARLFGNPAGTIIFHAANTAPTGYLKANGAAVSRTTYAALFAAIGTTFGAGNGSTTFTLPDMRGEVPRGWDDGRGVDGGRAFGSAQLDQIQRILGEIGSTTTHGWEGLRGDPFATGPFSFSDPNGDRTGSSSSSNVPRRIQFDTSKAGSGTRSGAETRSRNVALLACIKF